MLAQPPPTTLYYYQPPPTRTYAGYRHVQSNALGVTQIIIGVLCIIFNGVTIASGDWLGIICHGFWNGIVYIVAGSLGIAAAMNKSRCTIIGFMVMCIISAVMTTTLLALGILGAIIPWAYIGDYCDVYTASSIVCSASMVIAMEMSLAILGLIEAIVAIWGSVICCHVVCCCSGVGVYPTDEMPQLVYPNQMLFVTQQQHMQNGSNQPMQSIQAQYWNEQQRGFTMALDGSYLNKYPPSQITTANQEMDPPEYKTPIGQYNMPN